MAAADPDVRSFKLANFFKKVIGGHQVLQSSHDGGLFIEAVCDQADPAACMNQLIASPKGLLSLQASMRSSTSLPFLNGPATLLLAYFQEKTLKFVSEGDFLRQIILHIVQPPIFWDAYTQAFKNAALELPAQRTFAWLLLEIHSLSKKQASECGSVAEDPIVQSLLLKSSLFEVRVIGERIKHLVASSASNSTSEGDHGPGGRHDNDFPEYRDIAILPTADELTSEELPFMRTAQILEEIEDGHQRLTSHLDNQFRLLREEMLGEVREELSVLVGKKNGRHKGIVATGFTVLGVHCGNEKRYQPWGLQLKSKSDLPSLFKPRWKSKERKAYLAANKNVFRHQSLACLFVDEEIVAFPTMNRDEELLSQLPPVIVLQFSGEASTARALLRLKTAKDVKVAQVDSAVFAFEPVLRRLQEIRDIPLKDELLFWNDHSIMREPSSIPTPVVDRIRADPHANLQNLLGTPHPIELDGSQSRSLLMSLTQSLSLVQGPPGTGKSFIGALIAKSIYDFTRKSVLVVCYTNHALDQFLEDLLDIGIPPSAMVRLGGKSSLRTKPLSLYDQSSTYKFGKADWKIINDLEEKASWLKDRLRMAIGRYTSTQISRKILLEHLEFGDSTYYEAFTVDTSSDGMSRVGKKGKAINEFYLFDQWRNGRDAGIFKNAVRPRSRKVWEMPASARRQALDRWSSAVLEDQASAIVALGQEFNNCQRDLDRKWGAKHGHIISEKRIIACTTTAAAKYVREVQAAEADVLLVEEAGEILESHILTALGQKTEQLVLIGDHQQLRPKVNNYLLSVEKGEGFDLNRSLFERLILRGLPHQTLTKQHRMRPAIASLVRHLTYPDLVDAPSTVNRPALRGFLADVVFVSHDKPEDDNPKAISSWGSSKQNLHEAQMVLKCVKYLGQNGYGTDQIVVLTPYLAQLQLLRTVLSEENDPVLNDMDCHDLVKAGLMTAATAKVTKRPIKISSIGKQQPTLECTGYVVELTMADRCLIDNYQGEEADIVVVTMTRSNASCDIGFMAAPERLNVLLSRARNALVMIGNATTFINARKGGTQWKRLFQMLGDHGHIYDGFPLKCERHPNRTSLMKEPADFDKECRDGGCSEPWQKRAFERQQKREEAQKVYARQMAEMDEKIGGERERLRDSQLLREMDRALQQKKHDLANAATMANRASTPSVTPTSPSVPASTAVNSSKMGGPPTPLAGARPDGDNGGPAIGTPHQPRNSPSASEAEAEWKRLKEVENMNNDAIDSVMDMVGLEAVKVQVLRIKSKIDTCTRQGTDLSEERFGMVLLGNPGTGKTTIARLYAKILTSLGVLPGDAFVETTGSRLAHDGVVGAKKHVEHLQNAGGGVLFIDEAYQLTGQQNLGGGLVVDFLLAEIENNIGKIVVVLAGYNKQMEKFFEHNPGLPSRIPYSLQFADYTDPDLHQMLRKLIVKKYGGQMTIDDGIDGLYMRIVVTRLGRGRGQEGFGNARALQNVFSRISERQAERLARDRRQGLNPDDFYMSNEDLIGPDPSEALTTSEAWTELQGLIGIEAVKESIRTMLDRISENYRRELREKPPIEVSLNTVFLGSPGTGKTSVAKLYGQILADIGLLSNGEVVTKNPADFVGSHLGESESRTKAILANTVGKVLIIDEAYMLYSGNGGSGAQVDVYKTAVIDTMVAEVQSVPGEDRCVLLLGYREQIEEMFQNVNPGLARRFAIDDAFHFQDFTSTQLRQILDLKLKHQQLDATDAAKDVAMEVLGRSRRRPNFGNAGEVENLLSKAKGRYQSRMSQVPPSERPIDLVFAPQDFDPDVERGARAAMNCRELFADVVGCEDIVEKLESYQQIASVMRLYQQDPLEQIPTSFVFRGPPGTGKTTTARKMGQIFYDLGFLSAPEVIECSATDLVGQYIGQTGPRTLKQLEKALGKVLFIDEAYRLGAGHFAGEALNEIVDQLTKPRFMGKLLVILAGYDEDMHRLMAVNAGLSSRFPEEVVFHNMTVENCLKLLDRELRTRNIVMDELGEVESTIYQELGELIKQLSDLPSWGNARDVKILGKSIMGVVFKQAPVSDDIKAPLTLSETDALDCTRKMLIERKARDRRNTQPATSLPLRGLEKPPEPAPLLPPSTAPPSVRTITTIQNSKSTTIPDPDDKEPEPRLQPSCEETPLTMTEDPYARDAGVSDAIWTQLQADIAAQTDAGIQTAAHLRLLTQRLSELNEKHATARADVETLRARDTHASSPPANENQNENEALQELKRLREAAHHAEISARMQRREAERALERRREVEREQREQERKAQAKLREMGVCVAGFRWIKQEGGYRCAGGSHFVGVEELGL
ncbi:MAG: hypothetical protein M1817_000929 [Caeruleum heppii]|nr:MAG: hypothetical protein M1817_000929 [Caeruleum heppii]